MNHVVFQDRGYLLRDEFWQDCHDAGFEPTLVELKNGKLTTRTISREEFAARFTGRVASWVRSEPKSVSVFREALGKPGQLLFNRFYHDVIVSGLEAVAGEFAARTGAQGKVRLPAEASFVVFIHGRAKDGSPQLHAHVVIGDRVRVQGQEKTFATHKRELYQLRKLFDATTTQTLGHRLQKEWGVRVEKAKHGVILTDVPKSLCERSSVRTRQIDDYIKRNNLKNTPLTRKYAAIVTRRENQNPQAGRVAFERELAQSGFRSAQIMSIASSGQKRQPLREQVRRIKGEVKTLARNQRTITKNDLLAKALETADVRRSTAEVKRAAERVLASANKVGLRQQKNDHGQTVYVSRRYVRQLKKLADKVQFVLKAKSPEQQHQQKAKPDGGNASANGTRQEQSRGERSTNVRRVVEKALRSYGVIGAVGQAGIKAAKVAADLYQTWAKPVWRVHGNGHKNMPGSVAKMVRDLKPLGVIDSHKAAISAMLKLNGSLEAKLRYGEYVYRQSRKAKFRIPRKSLIVVRDAGSANPKDLNFLLRKAERAKAKTIFVESEHSKSALLQQAKSMQPGEHRHFQTQEMKR